MIGSSSEAINALNQVIAVYPSFVPGLVEKAVILAADKEWEQSLDTVQVYLHTHTYTTA